MISNLKYRPEIDGLRAIAVTSVILFHANLVNGGFLGVDIFFVISGYLISFQILDEIKQKNSFSFINFYKRRAKRILPVLLIVKLISLIIGLIIFTPSNLIDLAKSAVSSLFFVSNFYFWNYNLDYNATSAIFHPLLHTWSLSVEEQFYIIFPLILFFFKGKKLILLVTLISFSSFILANFFSFYYESINFYIIITRIWEFATGFLIAHNQVYQKKFLKFQNLNSNLVHTIALIALLLCIFLYNKDLKHPSVFTFLPIFLTFIIINVDKHNTIIYKILSLKPLVFIGLISYSLYLWHFPVFSFAQHLEIVEGSLVKKFLVGISIVILSVFSYNLIEKRFRDKKIKLYKVFSVILVNFLIILIVANLIFLKKGFPDRLPEILKNYFISLENYKIPDCIKDGNCDFNIEDTKKVYLIGDSHMQSLADDLSKRIIKKNLSVKVSTRPWCFYFPDFELVHKNNNRSTGCNKDYFGDLEKKISLEKDSIFIFSGRLPVYLDNKFFNNKEGGKEGDEFFRKFISNNNNLTLEESFKRGVRKILKSNKVILIYPIPEVGWRVPDKIMSNKIKKFIFSRNIENLTTSYKVYKDRTKSSFILLDSIENKNLIRFYPHKIFCNRKRCSTHDDKNVYYKDDDHLSIYGAKLLNDSIIELITNLK